MLKCQQKKHILALVGSSKMKQRQVQQVTPIAQR